MVRKSRQEKELTEIQALYGTMKRTADQKKV